MRGINDDLVPTELQTVYPYEPDFDPPENPEYEAWCQWVDDVADIRALEGADL